MMYAKYIKYKSKYLNRAQTGGFNELSSAFLIIKDNELLPMILKPVVYKLLEDKNDKFYKEGYSVQFDKARFDKYVYYKDGKLEEILHVFDNKVINSIKFENGFPIEKVFWFYYPEADIKISLTDFVKEDETFTSGRGTINVKLNDIVLNGDVSLEKIPKKRNIAATIKELNVDAVKIQFINEKKFTSIQDIINLFNRQDALTIDKIFTSCSNLFKDDIPKQYFDKIPIFRHIVSTVCANLYYKKLPVVRKLVQYPAIFKLIVKDDLNDLITNIGTMYEGDESLKWQHINDLIKKLPSNMITKYLLFKNKNGEFQTAKDGYDIIFDSGNEHVTMIGSDLVRDLGIPVVSKDKCEFTVAGIGSQKMCGDYVLLEFKFDNKYSEANNKVYQIVAFINYASKNELILGHIDGLNKLFADNYVIASQYEKDNLKEKKVNDTKSQAMIDVKQFKNYISQFKDSRQPIDIKIFSLMHFAGTIKFQYIKVYYPIEMTEINKMLRELRDSYKNTTDARTINESFDVLDDKIKNS